MATKGRMPDTTANKIFTPKAERGPDGNMRLTVEFNDDKGSRHKEHFLMTAGNSGVSFAITEPVQ